MPATVLMTRPTRRQVHQPVPLLSSQRKPQLVRSSSVDHLKSSPRAVLVKPSSVARSAKVLMTLKAMAMVRRESGIPLEKAMLLQREAVHLSTCPHQPKLVTIKGAQKRRRGQRDQLLSSQLSVEKPRSEVVKMKKTLELSPAMALMSL